MKKLLLAALVAAAPLTLLAHPQGSGFGLACADCPRDAAVAGKAATGATLMTPEERNAHREKMRSFTDPAACRSYMEEHHQMLESRAQAQGMALPRRAPGPMCERLQAAR